MAYQPIEETRVYGLACDIGDQTYSLVAKWSSLAQDTIGKQMIRAADSIGANLVKGDARRSDADSARYFRYARSSARETRHWISRARKRGLVNIEDADRLHSSITDCGKMISGLLEHRSSSTVREPVSPYEANEWLDAPDPKDRMTERPKDRLRSSE